MNNFENQIIETLIDLKENYYASAVKSEFETEGASFEETLFLKSLADKASLDFSIKIGGCGAVKELFEAKNIAAKNIIAPMIETPYALQKFHQSINTVFNEFEQKNTNFFINIETITGFRNFDEIINSEYFDIISGIVLGRLDMSYSIGLSRNDVNSNPLFNVAKSIISKLKSSQKKLIIGGGVSTSSIPFFKNLEPFSAFETRKIIFNSDILKTDKTELAIKKAIEFELLWLNNKKNNKTASNEDLKRISMLEQNCEFIKK